MRAFFIPATASFLLAASFFVTAQAVGSSSPKAKVSDHDPVAALHETSAVKINGQLSGASFVKCDSDGYLYIRGSATSANPLLAPVVKVDSSGKIIVNFDPSDFSQLALDRADAFTPLPDGGLDQLAQKDVIKPELFVLHFASDGTPSSSPRLEATFEAYAFAAFLDGTFLVSGLKRDVTDEKDKGKNFTAVFSADGRELSSLHLRKEVKTQNQPKLLSRSGQSKVPSQTVEILPAVMDLAEAEAGNDGYLYLLRRSVPAVIDVVSSSGEVVRSFNIVPPMTGATPVAFHVSGNRMAILFSDEKSEESTMLEVDAQNGQRVSVYSIAASLGTTFACYSANDDSFTFLRPEETGTEIVRADAR